VGGLIELLGVEGGTNAKGDTLTEENVVGDGGHTSVVELTLLVVS
jgi:hypothetical protein